MSMVGGASAVKPATREVQELCNKVREALQNQAGRTFGVYTAISFRSQMVAGTNYFVKVQVDENDEHFHLRIFVPLPSTNFQPSLAAYQPGHTAASDLEYFDAK
ncbi:cystatin-B-like [Haliotis rufescens]|uniref:cystatin-B-like n=1 Tax=Haliotis rufescens TaxID=6454 RepID=UPI00201F5519|nr:cystatin-B-like [Haliotis rufescens]